MHLFLAFHTHHLLISLERDLEDVSLLRLGQEEKHGLGLVCGRADENHASFWVVKVILQKINAHEAIHHNLQMSLYIIKKHTTVLSY